MDHRLIYHNQNILYPILAFCPRRKKTTTNIRVNEYTEILVFVINSYDCCSDECQIRRSLDTGCYLTSTLLVFEHDDNLSFLLRLRERERKSEEKIAYLWKISETILFFFL